MCIASSTSSAVTAIASAFGKSGIEYLREVLQELVNELGKTHTDPVKVVLALKKFGEAMKAWRPLIAKNLEDMRQREPESGLLQGVYSEAAGANQANRTLLERHDQIQEVILDIVRERLGAMKLGDLDITIAGALASEKLSLKKGWELVDSIRMIYSDVEVAVTDQEQKLALMSYLLSAVKELIRTNKDMTVENLQREMEKLSMCNA